MLKTGIIGTIIVAICCFTPVLLWAFATVGLAGVVVYLDFVVLPLLVVFAGITIWAFWKRQSVEGQNGE